MEFDIWVDADSLPKNLRPIVLNAAARLGCKCTFVADRTLKDVTQFISDDTFNLRQKAREQGQSDDSVIKAIKSKISMVVVSSGENSADDYIVEKASAPCLCITHDIPLAARLLEKKCIVLDDRGHEYSDSDIKVRLTDRLVNQELRSWGVFADQQAKMGNDNKKAFSDAFDRTITRMCKGGK
ncbi:MAG: DUF188 domain-containing protein [Sphaerochaetaceae bacterium]|nr:DUF188 domain-containing protein [Sphaerochaetaceae bacterium]